MRKLILASLTISAAASLQAQSRGSLQQRITRLLDQPPFDRATWNVYAQDDRGHVLFNRNGDHFSVPASNTKLVVAAAATVLLPADYRVRTSVYANGTVTDGVLKGDLILYGRGDPTWSQRCYAVDTLAPGACDSTWTAVDAIADSLKAHGLRRVTGRIVGDGSYFEPTLTHWNWGSFDLNWWYAAPVSGLGFHDNSVDFQITPGGAVDQPPSITWNPDLHLFTFENRARTVPADSGTTIGDNFFRRPGTWDIWAAGTVALVFRIDPAENVPLPRRLELIAPIFPPRPVRREDRVDGLQSPPQRHALTAPADQGHRMGATLARRPPPWDLGGAGAVARAFRTLPAENVPLPGRLELIAPIFPSHRSRREDRGDELQSPRQRHVLGGGDGGDGRARVGFGGQRFPRRRGRGPRTGVGLAGRGGPPPPPGLSGRGPGRNPRRKVLD